MKLEVLEKDFVYHIYNRGINGTNIFNNEENKIYFLSLIDKYLSSIGFIYAYCLMDNHFHLLFASNAEGEIATQKISNLFNAYAKAFNKMYNRTASLFEKHFRRIRVPDESYLRSLIIYIHMNPKHHFGLDFTSFKFSSYNGHISDRPTKLMRREVLELFGGRDNFVFAHHERNSILEAMITLE